MVVAKGLGQCAGAEPPNMELLKFGISIYMLRILGFVVLQINSHNTPILYSILE